MKSEVLENGEVKLSEWENEVNSSDVVCVFSMAAATGEDLLISKGVVHPGHAYGIAGKTREEVRSSLHKYVDNLMDDFEKTDHSAMCSVSAYNDGMPFRWTCEEEDIGPSSRKTLISSSESTQVSFDPGNTTFSVPYLPTQYTHENISAEDKKGATLEIIFRPIEGMDGYFVADIFEPESLVTSDHSRADVMVINDEKYISIYNRDLPFNWEPGALGVMYPKSEQPSNGWAPNSWKKLELRRAVEHIRAAHPDLKNAAAVGGYIYVTKAA